MPRLDDPKFKNYLSVMGSEILFPCVAKQKSRILTDAINNTLRIFISLTLYVLSRLCARKVRQRKLKNNITKLCCVSSIQFNMTFKETYFIVTKYSSLGYLLRIYVLLCARLFLISCRVILILIYRYKKTKKDSYNL